MPPPLLLTVSRQPPLVGSASRVTTPRAGVKSSALSSRLPMVWTIRNGSPRNAASAGRRSSVRKFLRAMAGAREVSNSSSVCLRGTGRRSCSSRRCSTVARTSSRSTSCRSRSASLATGPHRIAQAAVGADRVEPGIDFPQLGPQRLDVGVHAAFETGGGIGPGPVHQLRSRKHSLRLSQQSFEKEILVAGQVQGPTTKANAGPVGVDLEPDRIDRLADGRVFHGGVGPGGALEDGLDPGGEFARTERFADVVVRAQLQPEHPVELGVAGGEDGYRHLRNAADPLEQFQTGTVGQSEIEDDQIVGDRRQFDLGLASQGAPHRLEPLARQREFDDFGDGRFVLDQQDAGNHRRMGWAAGLRGWKRLAL